MEPFNVSAERERHLEGKVRGAKRKQAAQCAALQLLAARITPETMESDPTAVETAMLDMQQLLREQAVMLTLTANAHWRKRALEYFKTDRQFTLLYLDPPWQYKSNNRACNTSNHYDTMSDRDLELMPVRGLMHENSAMLMWATAPKMHVAQRLFDAWGFEYKTVFVTWVKVTASGQHPIYSTGGAYTRPNAEFLLLGTRGKLHVKERASCMVDSVIETRRSEHSHKPNVVRDMIVQVFGDRTRIELFTRETVPGWFAWGNEATKFNELYAKPDDEDAALDEDVADQRAKRVRLLPIRPGRTRANNRSAKRTVIKEAKPLPLGTRDRGPCSANEYYNKPQEGTKMTMNDFIIRGYDNSELREFNRVADLRTLFGKVSPDDERHSTYPTMTVGEARRNESIIRRMQEHNDEILFSATFNSHQRPVIYSDAEMADIVAEHTGQQGDASKRQLPENPTVDDLEAEFIRITSSRDAQQPFSCVGDCAAAADCSECNPPRPTRPSPPLETSTETPPLETSAEKPPLDTNTETPVVDESLTL